MAHNGVLRLHLGLMLLPEMRHPKLANKDGHFLCVYLLCFPENPPWEAPRSAWEAPGCVGWMEFDARGATFGGPSNNVK